MYILLIITNQTRIKKEKKKDFLSDILCRRLFAFFFFITIDVIYQVHSIQYIVEGRGKGRGTVVFLSNSNPNPNPNLNQSLSRRRKFYSILENFINLV